MAAITAAAQAQLTGIASTKHNLSFTQAIAGANHVTDASSEICVFCHTPHGANTTAEAPLWNKALPASSYNAYSSTTVDGNIAAVGSVSIACLSCHDGAQAMDNMINAPGSGNYNPAGARQSYTWTGNTVDTAAGKLAGTNNIAMLDTDLRNDHPIGIEYCGGMTTLGAWSTCRDKDFVAGTSGTVNGNTVWWVDTSGGTTGVRERTDMILYTRSGDPKPRVECASCHDPHVASGSRANLSGGAGPASGATFLRLSNAGSAVCLSCHAK